MDWTFLLVLQVIFQPSLSVLFTVAAERTFYKSEFGGNVVMGCKLNSITSINSIKITWQKISPDPVQQVIRIDNQIEQDVSPSYQGRVHLLSDKLKEGWAKLQISNLRINDSGTYRCLVHTKDGADYKTISLSVLARYKTVRKHVEKVAESDQVMINCQSDGYPKSSVVWQDGLGKILSPNTTVVSTPDGLFTITSQIRVNATERNNYTCQFTNDGTYAIFRIPEDIPWASMKKDLLIITLTVAVSVVVVVAGVLTYRRRKVFGSQSPRNLLPDTSSTSESPSARQVDPENDDEITSFRDDCHTVLVT